MRKGLLRGTAADIGLKKCTHIQGIWDKSNRKCTDAGREGQEEWWEQVLGNEQLDSEGGPGGSSHRAESTSKFL